MLAIFFFLMWTIFTVLIEFVIMLLLSHVLALCSKACRILDPWPGIKPAPSALEGKALTTGPPGKSQTPLVLDKEIMQMLCPTVLRTLPSPPPPAGWRQCRASRCFPMCPAHLRGQWLPGWPGWLRLQDKVTKLKPRHSRGGMRNAKTLCLFL